MESGHQRTLSVKVRKYSATSFPDLSCEESVSHMSRIEQHLFYLQDIYPLSTDKCVKYGISCTGMFFRNTSQETVRWKSVSHTVKK